MTTVTTERDGARLAGQALAKFTADHAVSDLRYAGIDGPFRARYVSIGDDDVALRSLAVDGIMTATVQLVDAVLVCWSTGGSATLRHAGRVEHLEIGVPTVVTDDVLGVDLRVAKLSMVRLRAGFVADVDADRSGGLAHTVAFEDGPSSLVGGAHRWSDAVRRSVTGPTGARADGPSLRASLAHDLSIGLLDAFRHHAVSLAEPVQTVRPVVRRAVDFVDRTPLDRISVTALSRASECSVRTLQEAFRSELHTTPTRYVRDRRLDAVHVALLGAVAGTTTVAESARAAGFGHLGRFSAAYESRFGEYPAQTLRS